MKFFKLFLRNLFILLFAIGCGGGGGDNSNNINVGQLAGTYSLTGFTVEYDDATILTQNTVSSYSGTMTITSNGDMTQSVTLNGNGLSLSGTFSILSNSIMRMSVGGCTYDMGYSFNNNVFTTSSDSGTCGSNSSEIDVWQKTSSIATINASLANKKTVQNDINNIAYDKNIGGLIGQHGTPHIY